MTTDTLARYVVAHPRNTECRYRHGPDAYVRADDGRPRCRVCQVRRQSGKYRATGVPARATSARIGQATATKTERNAAIVAGIAAGRMASDVAAEHGISRERARQIWTRATGLPVPSSGQLCRRCGGRFVGDPGEHTKDPDHLAAIDRRRAMRRERTIQRWWDSLMVGDCWEGPRSSIGYATSPLSRPRQGAPIRLGDAGRSHPRRPRARPPVPEPSVRQPRPPGAGDPRGEHPSVTHPHHVADLDAPPAATAAAFDPHPLQARPQPCGRLRLGWLPPVPPVPAGRRAPLSGAPTCRSHDHPRPRPPGGRMTARARSPRLPRHRMAPGQLTLESAMARAQQRYPEAVRFHRTRNAEQVLALLPGGSQVPAAPAAAKAVAA